MTYPGQNLRWTSHREGDTTTMRVFGEVDLISSPAFEDAATSLLEETKDLVLDLSAVSYMDSTGLSRILRLVKVAEERNVRFRIGEVSPSIAALLNVTDLVNMIPFVGAPPERPGASGAKPKRARGAWPFRPRRSRNA